MLRCVMFRRSVAGIGFEPMEGEDVLAFGRVTVYERHGQYQLLVDDLVPAGTKGLAALQLERLKERLAGEGLFDSARKKELPAFPAVVGVVTSPTGAALRDIIRVTRRRWPAARILLSPAQVQGSDAPRTLAKAIELQNMAGLADVLIVGRGGGAREDLSAFNEEIVVRAIAASAIPIVSAVGHETDTTLADLAADVRAPTPSAAAERAVPEGRDLTLRVFSLGGRIERAMGMKLELLGEKLRRLQGSHGLRGPRYLVQEKALRFDELGSRLKAVMDGQLNQLETRFTGLDERLAALNPMAVLQRGYTLCVDPRSRALLARAKEVQTGQLLEVVFSDGEVTCQAIKTTQPT